MAVSYSFEGRLFRLDCVGIYSTDEVKEAFAAALADPALPADTLFLLDVSKSESLTTRPVEDLRDLVDFMGPRAVKVGKKCAILAQDDLHFGLMNMAAIFAERHGVEAQVFRTLGQALDWLGVSPTSE